MPFKLVFLNKKITRFIFEDFLFELTINLNRDWDL